MGNVAGIAKPRARGQTSARSNAETGEKAKPRASGQTSVQSNAKTGEEPDVFISYQWSKQPQIKALSKKLREKGYTCWLDIDQLKGGDPLNDKIDRGIRGCKVVISCVTQEYSDSKNCCREVSLADAIPKPIIPLLLEKIKWPPSGPMSMVFSQLLYIKFDEKSQEEWTGPKFDELMIKLEHLGVNHEKCETEGHAGKGQGQEKPGKRGVTKGQPSAGETTPGKPDAQAVVAGMSLHKAAANGDEDKCKELLRKGVDVSLREDGKTAVQIALERKHRGTARLLLDHMCQSFPIKHGVRVWPGYRADNPEEIVIVVQVLAEETRKEVPKVYCDYPTETRLWDQESEEAKIVCGIIEKVGIKKLFDALEKKVDLENVIGRHGDNLMNKHTNLTIIGPSTIKSMQQGAKWENEQCIVLYCRTKGIVPLDEELFPSQLDGVPTDVREGYFSRGCGPPENADEYNACLRVGCSIGKKGKPSGGTLGGFVCETSGKKRKGFLTAAHVVLDEEQLKDARNSIKQTQLSIVQPSDDDLRKSNSREQRDRECGHVHDACFKHGQCAVGVDAAVVIIDKREPCPSGEFCNVPAPRRLACGFDTSPCYNSGKFVFEITEDHLEHGVYKFGRTTGMTRGQLGLKGWHVRYDVFEGSLRSMTVSFPGQLQILSTKTMDSNKFFDLGDSGSLVFLRQANELHCICLAIGFIPGSNICIATPIKAVMEAFGQEFQLAAFHESMETE